MDFNRPTPQRPRPQRPSYAPVTTKELLLDGNFQDRPGLPIAEADPGKIVRSPGNAIVPQLWGASVHQPRGLVVNQRYPIYATPGCISSESGTKTQPTSKARFRCQLRKFSRLKLPNLSKLPKWQFPHWNLPVSTPSTTTKQDKPKSQTGKPLEKLVGLKLPKSALSGTGFGSIGLGKPGKPGGKSGSDNFGDDPITQLLVKVFLVVLILIPLIL